MSTQNTPNRKLSRACESTPSPARFRTKKNRKDENFSQEKIVEGQFDENANAEFHTPSKLQIKNGESKTPRTPKPTFEEEQEELKRSLSKDWCDKMDNEEAEEKKLHSFVLYLKQFPIHENKTTEEILASIECSPKELLRRQKEISKGKLSNAYQTYISQILRKSRTRQHPRTPCKYAKMSRRGFDGAIKAWRRKLYEFSGEKKETDTDSTCSSQRSDGCSTPSMSIDENEENYLPDLYDFEESLNNKFEPFVEIELTDSMDTIVQNVDSRSAMAFD